MGTRRRCKPLGDYESLFLNSLLHIFILSIVLTLFFFIVISKIETEELTQKIMSIVKQGIDGETIPKNEYISENLLRLSKLYIGKNKEDEIYNQTLLYSCIFFIIIVGVTFITLLITLKHSSKKCTNFLSILLENILLFICVGIVEFIFFINIGMKYIPVMPSYVNNLISNNM